MYRRNGSSYQLIKLVEETGQVGFWAFDFATGKMAGSPGLTRITGLPSAESPLGLLNGLIHPDDRGAQTGLVELLLSGMTIRRSYRIVRPDRTARCVKVIAEIVLGNNERPARAEGVVFDISELYEAARSAKEDKARHHGLIDAIGTAVWSVSADGTRRPSASWQAVTGQSIEAQLNGEWLGLVHADDRQRMRTAWEDALERHLPIDIALRIRCIDGGYRWFNNREVPLFDESGILREWIGVLLVIAQPVGEIVAEPTDIPLTGPLVRAARGFLQWSISDLAVAANVSVASIKRFEANEPIGTRRRTLNAVREALERAGIVFREWEGRTGVFCPRVADAIAPTSPPR